MIGKAFVPRDYSPAPEYYVPADPRFIAGLARYFDAESADVKPEPKSRTVGIVLGVSVMQSAAGGYYLDAEDDQVPLGVQRYGPWLAHRWPLTCGCQLTVGTPIVIRHDTNQRACLRCATDWRA